MTASRGRRDLLVPGRVRMIAVVRQVVRLVVCVVRAFERGAQVDVRRPGRGRRRLDDVVDVVGHLRGGGDVRIALCRRVLAAEPDTPVIEQHHDGSRRARARGRRSLQVGRDGRDPRQVAGDPCAAEPRVGDIVRTDLDLDDIRSPQVGGHASTIELSDHRRGGRAGDRIIGRPDAHAACRRKPIGGERRIRRAVTVRAPRHRVTQCDHGPGPGSKRARGGRTRCRIAARQTTQDNQRNDTPAGAVTLARSQEGWHESASTAGLAQVIVKMPFIPAAAWPGTVHLYGYVPFRRKTILSVADLPGEITLVFRPWIWKS